MHFSVGFVTLVVLSTFFGVDGKQHYRIGTELSKPFYTFEDDKYEGFFADLCDELMKIMDGTYEMSVHENHGSFDAETKTWDGLIGDLLEHKIDLIITRVVEIFQETDVVDVSVPFLTTGSSIVYAFPIKQAILFHNLESLVDQSRVNYGVVYGSYTYNFLRAHTETNSTIKKMRDYFAEHGKNIFLSNEEGIKKVSDKQGYFALFTEVATFPMWKEKYPKIEQFGGIFNPAEYAIMTPKNSSNLGKINDAIKELKSNGVLNDLKKKWGLKDD